MIKIDEEALICDLAETYQIYDYKHMPPSQVAIFAIGLRDNARIKMKVAGLDITPEIMLQSAIVDRLGIMVWQRTEDGQKGRNRPKSILETLLNKTNESEVSNFTSGKEFEEERQRLLSQMKGGN